MNPTPPHARPKIRGRMSPADFRAAFAPLLRRAELVARLERLRAAGKIPPRERRP